MSEWKFPATVQIAIRWVENYLLKPRDTEARPVPKRVDNGWFTRIETTPIVTNESLCDDIEVIERQVFFYLGELMVVRVQMMGVRYYRDSTGRPPRTEWCPSEVEYRTEWVGDQGQLYREELIGFPVDLPATLAADD